MRGPGKYILLLLALAAALGLPCRAGAEFRLNPSVEISERYDDNIFLTPSNEEGDFITRIFPRIDMFYETRLLDLSFNYGLAFNIYQDHSELNDTDVRDTQRAKLDASMALYKDIFSVRVYDEYSRVVIDERDPVAYDNVFVNLTDSNRFSITPLMRLPLTQTLSLETAYTYQNIWYEADVGDDTEDHTFSASLIKQLSPKLTTSLQSVYRVHQPDLTPEYERVDGLLGVVVNVSPDIVVSGSGGRTWFDFEDDGDFDSGIWNVRAEVLLTDVVSLAADYSNDYLNSVNLGVFRRRMASATLGYVEEVEAENQLVVFMSEDTYVALPRKDKATGVILSPSVPITPRMTGRLDGRYTYYEFLPEDEEASRYGFRLSLDYELRITTVTLSYTLNINDSSVDENDYQNNIVSVGARFDL